MILDFHCHITTPNSRLPQADGGYYRTLAGSNPAGHLLGQWTQEAVDAMGERL